MFSSTKILMQANKNVVLQINFVTNVNKIGENLKWQIKTYEQKKLQYNGLSSNFWCLAEKVADTVGIPGFIDVLAVFIKQKQKG